MAAATLGKDALWAIIEAHPDVHDRVVSIAMAIVDSEGNLKEADAAEERIVEETRLLGRTAMQSWAENQVAATEQDIRQQPGMHRQGTKQLYWHTKFGEIEVSEPQYRFENTRVRPFLNSAKIISRGCSLPLQRAIVDFAADQPFAVARLKMIEHYGVEIGESVIQRITLGHAQAMHAEAEADLGAQEFPQAEGRHKEIVAEPDGGMIPIVEPDPSQKDKRKGKMLSWREAKLCLAHAKGSKTPVYAGTIAGGVETAGQQLLECAVRAGFGANSHVHAVGDGAPWIVGQVEEQFGAQGSYLIDFYHVCDYLSDAAKAIVPDAAAQKALMDGQKDALKTGRLDQVLRSLAGHIEPPETDDDSAPVRKCHRYLSERRAHLNYRDALANDLPIGSGEIESAHRYIAQQRLKRPGAWWRVDHAEYMLALRINRGNGDWAAYWAALRKTGLPANENKPATVLKSAA
jgi:hypothetical protein